MPRGLRQSNRTFIFVGVVPIKEQGMKRIYRIEKEKKIAGICAGLGELLTIDPTVIRLVLVLLAVATGVAPFLIAYVVGWVIIPDKTAVPQDDLPIE